jgi:spoIIIJ-associated protein
VEWVETTGRTLAEAQEAALDRLGVDSSDAEFEILNDARVGLFGRLRSEARVRARVRPTTPRPKDDRRDRRRRRQSANVGSSGRATEVTGRASGRTPAEKPSRNEPATSSAPAGAEEDRSAGRPNRSPARRGDTADTSGGERSRRRGGRRRRSSSGARSVHPGQPKETTSKPADSPSGGSRAESDTDKGEEVATVEVPMQEQVSTAEAFLAGLTQEMGLDVSIQSSESDEETSELALEGDDLGILIGQRGTTLHALQDLTRTVVQRQTGASNGRLLVDVGGYRAKRQAALARFAEQVAAEVHESGTQRVMEPMNAADRKVVHDTINVIAGVSTTSQGEDPQRYVVVIPED